MKKSALMKSLEALGEEVNEAHTVPMLKKQLAEARAEQEKGESEEGKTGDDKTSSDEAGGQDAHAPLDPTSDTSSVTADPPQENGGASAEADQSLVNGQESLDDDEAKRQSVASTSQPNETSGQDAHAPLSSPPVPDVEEEVATYTVKREMVEGGERYKVGDPIDLTESRRAALGALVE